MPGKKRESKYHMAGWILFVLCAFLFLYSAVRDGDGILALASLVFLFGCILFLVPLLFPHKEIAKASQCDNGNPPVEGS
jgi:hypothetical protein